MAELLKETIHALQNGNIHNVEHAITVQMLTNMVLARIDH